jgi:predicted XRE-type DNA-binding protein
MSEDDFELVHGSDTVYRDFGRPDAGLAQARARVAARIIQALDARALSTREAEKVTGVAHTEFSRVRNAQLRRFTLDRLITILGKLDGAVEVDVEFRSSAPEATAQVAGA